MLRHRFNIFICLLVSLLSACSPQKEKLQFNLEKGAVYHQDLNTSSVITQTMGQENVVINMMIGSHLIYKVNEVTDEFYGMEVQYKSMDLTMKNEGVEIRFDSKNKDTGDKVSLVMQNVINKTFFVKMNKIGKILNVEGLDNIMLNMFEGLPNLAQVQKEQIEQYIVQSFGTLAYKGNLESMTQIFKYNEVGEGDKWKTHSNIHTAMNSYIETEYELKELGKESCKIVGVSKIRTDENSMSGSGELNMTYDLFGSMQSDIQVDRKTGWIQNATCNIDIKGTIEMKGTPMQGERMSFPMSLKSNMVMTDESN